MVNSHINAENEEILRGLFNDHNQSINDFFNTIFSFFSKVAPDEMFDCEKHYGKQVLLSQYEKWYALYRHKINNSSTQSRCGMSHSESNLSSEMQDCWDQTPRPGGPTRTTNTTTTSKRANDSGITSTTKSEKEKILDDISNFEPVNGQILARYMWSQNKEEIDIRIPVLASVKNASQVKVDISRRSLSVRIWRLPSDSSEVEVALEGDLADFVKTDESVWFLSPGQHVSILLEKKEPKWWDRILTDESPIDLTKITSETPFESLPDDEKMKIAKIISDKDKQDRGELTSDQEKMASVLKEAWDAEGSPFKGQPFDPSAVKMVTSSAS